jgi:ferredoxin--NADP+ reductase
MKLSEYQRTETLTATVLSNSRLTPPEAEEVREILLQINEPGFKAEPGQSIGVIAPGSADYGNKEHFRLYTVADLPESTSEGLFVITLCVKRCDYIDEYSGELSKGVASNYLCDLKVGKNIQINGPFGLPFEMPANSTDDLILIGAGTGIAPFRAFIKKLYKENGEREGKVYLFHGARTGLEMLYTNDESDDLTQYYDKETFEAFQAVSPRPNFADPIALDYEIRSRADELWEIMQKPTTRIYIAGQEKILKSLDKVFASRAASPEAWTEFRNGMAASGRLQSILF